MDKSLEEVTPCFSDASINSAKFTRNSLIELIFAVELS